MSEFTLQELMFAATVLWPRSVLRFSCTRWSGDWRSSDFITEPDRNSHDRPLDLVDPLDALETHDTLGTLNTQ